MRSDGSAAEVPQSWREVSDTPRQFRPRDWREVVETEFVGARRSKMMSKKWYNTPMKFHADEADMEVLRRSEDAAKRRGKDGDAENMV